MNAPERSSTFLLDEDSGEQKVTYSTDTKVRCFILYYIILFGLVLSLPVFLLFLFVKETITLLTQLSTSLYYYTLFTT